MREESRTAFKILTGKPIGKRSLGRPSPRWEDNVRIDLKEIRINIRNWIDSDQNCDYWRSLCECSIESPGIHKPWD